MNKKKEKNFKNNIWQFQKNKIKAQKINYIRSKIYLIKL